MKSILLILAMALVCMQAVAAPENKPLPRGPLLARMPEFSHWIVTFSYPDAAKSGPGAGQRRLQTVDVIKTKGIYYEQRSYEDGSKSENWYVGNLVIYRVNASGRLNICEASARGDFGDSSLYCDYGKTDFPQLSWISPKSYTGTQTTGTTEYLLFQETVENFATQGSAAVVACVEEQTRVPSWIRSRQVSLSYEYGEPPSTMLALPTDIQRLLENRNAVIKALMTSTPSF